MKRDVERTHLLPEPVQLLRERVLVLRLEEADDIDPANLAKDPVTIPVGGGTCGNSARRAACRIQPRSMSTYLLPPASLSGATTSNPARPA